ncbi:hypothetical protein SESBI_04543 [Sesbania bispinosa]|nr:hypothetical protein SESBI_04543 [Sesbania bispinosa]
MTRLRRLGTAVGAAVAATACGGAILLSPAKSSLIGASSANPLDILVIGGGATGSGVALDAATRGLRVGLVEREDFSSGTSSRSTKLIHGGVRYLEKAVFKLDYGQLKLVFHALEERKQMNDARLNVGLACTAALAGAAVLNHAEVVSLLKDDVGERIIGARIRDNLTGKEFDTYAKVRRADVLSAWSGIRPLAMDPSAKNTESISRDHVVFEEHPGLVIITGGKWTTYRSMAEDAVNAAIKSGKLTPSSGCVTNNLKIIGGEGWDPASFTVLTQQYVRMKLTHRGKVVPGVMDTAAAKHLSHAYGTLADRVAAIAQNESLGKRLAHGYPFLEAEVAYCARHEYCESAIDFIARRSRLAFLDTDAAGRALPRVIQILAAEHKWDKSRQKQELQKAKEFLETFKSSKNAQFYDGKHN